MSQVFEAEHVHLGTAVAIKVLRQELANDRRAVARFYREARSLASLVHDNLVRVFDCAQDEAGRPFFVMELLRGSDLRQALAADGPFPIPRALHIALDICRGLSAVHQAGLIHRDIKPANLFLACDPRGRELCKILDLGVARDLDVHSTRDGSLIGTLRYMAPEQLVDSASVGPAADVYATGAVLYECITGRPPHLGENVEELMFQILNQEPVRPSALTVSVPRDVDELILTALARDPKHRFETIDRLAAGIDAALSGNARPADITASTSTGASTLREARANAARETSANRRAGLKNSLGAVLCIGLGWGLADGARPTQPAPKASSRESAGSVCPIASIEPLSAVEAAPQSTAPTPIGSIGIEPPAKRPPRGPASSVAGLQGPRARQPEPRQLRPKARGIVAGGTASDFDTLNPYTDAHD